MRAATARTRLATRAPSPRRPPPPSARRRSRIRPFGHFERERRQAAAPRWLNLAADCIDAGGRQRPSQLGVGVVTELAGQVGKGGDQHVAGRAARAIEVKDHAGHSTTGAMRAPGAG